MRTGWAYAMVFAWLVACGTVGRDAALRAYLTERPSTVSGRMPAYIFVITEEGCPVCDRHFADLLRTRTDREDCLFIVRAQGSSISLKGFLDEAPNIRFDDGRFKALGLLEGSGAILMNEGRIDSIIPLRTEGVEQQLAYFAQLIDKRP